MAMLFENKNMGFSVIDFYHKTFSIKFPSKRLTPVISDAPRGAARAFFLHGT
jgi:hypothetical protein